MKTAHMLLVATLVSVPAFGQARPQVATPTEVKPGSITCEECPYPYPSSYLPLTLYGQDVRMAYMDVPPMGQANGHTVVLLHGHNFAGFYFGGPIAVLATQDPTMVERLVLYNPIGLTDARFDRPWEGTDEAYKRTLGNTWATVKAG